MNNNNNGNDEDDGDNIFTVSSDTTGRILLYLQNPAVTKNKSSTTGGNKEVKYAGR